MFKIWPWSRIAALERQISVMDVQSRARIDMLEKVIDKLDADSAILARKLSEARKIESELRFQLKGAHFRDPKTGRIMKKGASK